MWVHLLLVFTLFCTPFCYNIFSNKYVTVKIIISISEFIKMDCFENSWAKACI